MNEAQNTKKNTPIQSNNQTQEVPQQSPPLTPPTVETKKQKNIPVITLSLLLIISLGVGGYFAFQYYRNSNKPTKPVVREPTVPSPTPTITPTLTPNPTPTTTLTPTLTPSPTSKPLSFAEEEKSMRKTISGFEMYIANSNTAGALSFFTPPTSGKAKQTLNNIKTQNLPFELSSWSFIDKGRAHNYELAVDKIKNGYRARVTECRTNDNECIILFLELVRSKTAENEFQIDRYYGTQYTYQNNLGEKIKYQGFGFE